MEKFIPNSNNLSEDLVSQDEAHFDAARKTAELKMYLDKYQRLGKGASGSSATNAELRLNTARKIAELKREIDKYQDLGKSPPESGDILSPKQADLIPTPIESLDQNGPQKSTIEEGFQEAGKTQGPESNSVVKQALKLLGQLGMKKRLSAK